MNYYEVLELNHNATNEMIKKNYRRLALKFHPDKNRGNYKPDSTKFQKITEAYSVLVNEEARERYDYQLKYGFYDDLFNNNDSNNINTFNISNLIKPFFSKIGIPSDYFDKLENWTDIDDKIATRIFEIALEELYEKINSNKATDSSKSDEINNLGENRDKNEKCNIKRERDSIKTVYRDLVINYEIDEHYRGEYIKEINLQSDSLEYKLEIDTSKKVHNIEVLLGETLYIIDIKCIANNHELYSLENFRNQLYLFHEITIPLQAFISGFYYELDLFGTTLLLSFNKLLSSNLLYSVTNYGLPKNNSKLGERDELYFKIKIETPTANTISNLSLIDKKPREGYIGAQMVIIV